MPLRAACEVAPAARFLRFIDITVQHVDVCGRCAPARFPDHDQLQPDAGLGQLRRLDGTNVVHVHQPGRDSFIAVLADESAPAGALLQADQTGMLERAQGLTKGIARDAKLLRQRPLRWQTVADRKPAGGKLRSDLSGNLVERAGRFNSLELRNRRSLLQVDWAGDCEALISTRMVRSCNDI